MDDLGIDEVGENGENALEVGEEGRVIKGPGASLIGVPLGEGEGVGQSEPMTVDLKVCAMIGWDQEELYTGNHAEEP